MKRGKKNSDAGDPFTNSDTRTGSSELNAMKPSLSSMKSMGLLLAVLMVTSVMFSLSVVLRDPPSDDVLETDAASRVLQLRLHHGKDLIFPLFVWEFITISGLAQMFQLEINVFV